jgi:hypothetical protein
MAIARTTGELCKAKAIADEDVTAAIDAYMEDPAIARFDFGEGHSLDLAAAVVAHAPARKALTDPNACDAFRRAMVRSAILLARPERR